MNTSSKSFWRAHRWDIGLGVLVVMFLGYVFGYSCDKACADWDYTSDLLLDDTGMSDEAVVWRWIRTPRVGVKNGTSEQIAAVRIAVSEMNRLLSDTDMNLLFDESDGDIVVEFISREDVERFAEESGDRELLDVEGYMIPLGNGEGVLEGARVRVLNNLSAGDTWGTILHELGHAVGMLGHTDRYLSSLYWVEWKWGAFSDGFSTDDRKLLHFLYNYLQPGDTEAEARAAFDQHWVVREDVQQ